MTTRFSGDAGAGARSTRLLRPLAIATALMVNVLILLVGRSATGDLPVAPIQGENQPIGFVQVICVTLVTGFAAWGLLALLEQMASRSVAIWTTIAFIYLIWSLQGPIRGGVDTESKVILTAMHIGAAVTIIPLMRKSAGARD